MAHNRTETKFWKLARAGLLFRSARALESLGVFILASIAALDPSCAKDGSRADPSLDLLSLQVFAKQSIQADRSDYEGPTAARGTIDLNDFQIKGDLTSGQRVYFQRGQVNGFVNTPDPQLSAVFSSGTGSVSDQALELASVRLDMLAARLSSLPPTARFDVELGSDGKTEFRTHAQRSFDVVDLAGDRLTRAGDDQVRLALTGNGSAGIVVRVHGRKVSLRHIAFSVDGGLNPSRVVFFFPEATDLEISESGGAQDKNGASLNIPGSIVAPSAALRFAASTVNGQVFARSISSIPGLPSGQVDRFTPLGTRGSNDRGGFFRPSELLEMADSDQFVVEHPAYSDDQDQSMSKMPSNCHFVCTRTEAASWSGLRREP